MSLEYMEHALGLHGEVRPEVFQQTIGTVRANVLLLELVQQNRARIKYPIGKNSIRTNPVYVSVQEHTELEVLEKKHKTRADTRKTHRKQTQWARAKIKGKGRKKLCFRMSRLC